MHITKKVYFSLILLLVGLQVSLSSCGSSSGSARALPGNLPDRVRIQISSFQKKPDVTLTDVSMVQQLYITISALPPMPEGIPCTLEMGPHYRLTFYQKQKTVETVLAEQDGCRPVSISGEPHSRTAMQKTEFWDQLDKAIYEATPVAKVDQLALMPMPSQVQLPQTAHISTPETAQHIYNAILALPLVIGNAGSLNVMPDYQLAFHTTNQSISAAVDLKQNLITLDGGSSSRGGTYRIDKQFRQLFAKTLAGVVFTPAQPDALLLRLDTDQTHSSSKVMDMQRIHQLFDRLFTFPVTQPPSESCLANDKMASKQQWYTLTFLQWDLLVLSVNAYEGSCISVKRGFINGQGQYFQADQEFWTQLHQVAGS